mgnify:CR=1 FL=1
MKMSRTEDGEVLLEMSFDELGTLRYELHEARMNRIQKSISFESLFKNGVITSKKEVNNQKRLAEDVSELDDNLEEAVQRWVQNKD